MSTRHAVALVLFVFSLTPLGCATAGSPATSPAYTAQSLRPLPLPTSFFVRPFESAFLLFTTAQIPNRDSIGSAHGEYVRSYLVSEGLSVADSSQADLVVQILDQVIMDQTARNPPAIRWQLQVSGRMRLTQGFESQQDLAALLDRVLRPASWEAGSPLIAPAGSDLAAAAAVVDRFLNAARLRDAQTMSRLFGTTDGSLRDRDGRENAELRMHRIAEMMPFSEYQLVMPDASAVTASRIRLSVTLRINNGPQLSLPFQLVPFRGGWLINMIDFNAISGR